MKFHILGVGPIGTLYAHYLRTVLPKSHTITLIHKTTHQAQLARQRQGLVVVSRGSTYTSTGFNSEAHWLPYKVPGRVEATEPIESLIVSTKAHLTVPAVTKLAPRLSRDSTIVLLQNGAGVYEELIQKVFPNRQERPHFILTCNTHGVRFQRFAEVIHSGVGEFDFAIVSDPAGRDFEAVNTENNLQLENIASNPDDPDFDHYRSLRDTVAAFSLLEPLTPSWKPMAELQILTRKKLVVNSVINPLTAILGCRNGRIFETVSGITTMQRICAEAADVYAAQIKSETKAWTDDLVGRGFESQDIPVGRIPRGLTREILEHECLRVAQNTKENVSSMLADIQRGRPTEIDYMNGYLLRLGKLHGVFMPVTATLRDLVRMRSDISLDNVV